MTRRTNEEGKPVAPIFDTEGLLTSICMNADELLRGSLDAEQKALVEGIRHMASSLAKSKCKHLHTLEPARIVGRRRVRERAYCLDCKEEIP
jgi:hypothetical protein